MLCSEHQNWFGIDENLGPVAVSIRRERVPASQDLLNTDTSITSRPANSDHWMYRSVLKYFCFCLNIFCFCLNIFCFCLCFCLNIFCFSLNIFCVALNIFSAQTDRAHERPAAAARDCAGGQHPRAQEREDQDDPHQGGPRVLLPRAATLQVGDSPIELQTMVKQRFTKISQSHHGEGFLCDYEPWCGPLFEALSISCMCIEVYQSNLLRLGI